MADESPVRPDDVIGGKYRVERVLGIGGMGVVVAAWHLDLEQRVAIKLMLRSIAEQSEAVERFLREARASVRLRSEHVAKVFDVGRLPSGEPFMVMEFLEGEDLAAVVRTRGPLPIAEAVDLLTQACEAIAEAHDQGITHRDLKPANLFLARGAHGAACVKVLDFGISKIRKPGENSGASGLTGTSAVMGTPYYMAPEQMRASKTADARSDIWALGAILFELLTGKIAYGGDSITEIVAAVMTEPAPRARQHRGEIPEELEQLICRCFAKQPEDRVQSVPAFVAAIAPYGTSRARESLARLSGASFDAPPRAAPVAPAQVVIDERSPSTDVSWGAGQTGIPLVRRKQTSKGRAIGFGVGAAVLLLAAGSWLGLRSVRSGGQAANAAPSDPGAPSSAPALALTAPASADSSSAPVPSAAAAPAPSAQTRDIAARDPSHRKDRHDAGGATAPSAEAASPPVKPEATPAPPAATPTPTPTTKSGIKDYGGRE